MNKKKITVSLLTIMTLFSINAFAKTDNTDVSTVDLNDNARQQSVQKIINEELNTALPNTDQDTALVPNIESRKVIDKENLPYGESSNGPYIAYKIEYSATKDGPTEKEIGNCKTNDGKTCKQESAVKVNEQDVFYIPESGKQNDDGFYLPLEKVVVTENALKKYPDETNSKKIEDYFYRYWKNDGTNCPSGHKSCYSSSYPIICLPGVANVGNIAEKLKNMEPEEAGRYFGERLTPVTEDLLDIVNGYYFHKNKGYTDYRIEVNVRKSENNEQVIGEGKGPGAIKIARWTMDPVSNCLKPDFTFTEHTVDGYKQTTRLDPEKPSELKQVSKLWDRWAPILPCGMYTASEAIPSGSGFFEDEMANKIVCSDDAFAFVTKGAAGKNDDGSFGVGNQYWTRYAIALPNLGGNGMSSEYNDLLNVRACARCEPAADHCQSIIKGLIEKGVACTCTAEEHLVKNEEGKDVTSTSCRDVNYVNLSQDEGVGATYTKYNSPAPKRTYTCTSADIDKLVKALVTEKKGFELEAYSGVFDHPLSCSICLNRLEQDLKSLFIYN